jgi:UDP-GlcNAc:undecaprenyl-phosphate GlcNAc-1-phosphate transferase
MWKLIYTYIFVFSFILAIVLVNLFRKLAIKLKILDMPQQARKMHEQATPLLGGIAMYFAFVLSIGFNLILVYLLYAKGKLPDSIIFHIDGIRSIVGQLTAIITTTSIIVVMGLVDDIKNLNPFFKLAVQIIMASIVFIFGIRISLFITNQFFSWLITVLWIVGITNAFNLLDNMDGLSSGTALIATIIFFLVAFLGNQFFMSTILACFAGILLGFLWFNFPPAKVFMGGCRELIHWLHIEPAYGFKYILY